MRRSYSTFISVLVLFLVLTAQGWAGDPAAKSAASDLEKGYEAAKRGYWKEAMARYLNATKNAPGDAEIWNNLGVALEAVGQYAEAGDAYRRALDIDPGNGKIYRNYGQYNEFYSSYIVVPEEVEEIEAIGEDQEAEVKALEEGDVTISPADEPTEEGADDAANS